MDYNITTEPAASSSSPSTRQWEYDVFLSFRGADTLHSFVDPLYSSLVQGGITTFWDRDQLHKEGDIPREIFEAIDASRISVVIFSENYASSTWCLEELAKILECKKSQKQIVMPIFYDVEPSDVRNQTGTFGEAFVEHESRFKDDLNKVNGWRQALRQAANLSGWDLNNERSEFKFVLEITEKISRLLKHDYLTYETDYLVGIDSRIREINDLLGVGAANDVRRVGIWGIGGMGKTTLAKAVYNSVAHKFDDVDQLDQLKYLAESSDWFGAGSRIIIPTRDEHLTLAHKVDFTYQGKELEPEDAMALFHSKYDYQELARRVVGYAQGNPLALTAMGSLLYGKRIDQWHSILDQWHSILESYERAPASNIHEILKITKKELEHDLQSTGFSDWNFLIISLILEIISAICDQLSSSEKPEFAVIGMVLAIVSLVICVSELINKGRKAEVKFGRCRMCLWWFFCPETDRLFGTLPDLFGLICGISQCASSIAQCVCVLRHKDNPFKVNVLPIIFLICLLVSKLFENCKRCTKYRKPILPS